MTENARQYQVEKGPWSLEYPLMNIKIIVLHILSRDLQLIKGDFHAHFVSKGGSSESPESAFRVYYTEQ